MHERLGRGLTFVVGSVVGGLALAFLIVAVRPDLIRREIAPSLPLPVASRPDFGWIVTWSVTRLRM